MALSFEDSLNATNEANVESSTVTTSASNDGQAASVASYSLSNENTAVAAYSLVDEGWTQDANYKYYDDFSDDNVSNIDDNKNIALNQKQFNITQEENSQFIPFEMPRYYDGYDLKNAVISIHYERSDGKHGVSEAVNVFYNDSKIRFGWLVDAYATEVSGNIKFEIHATGATFDSDGIEYGYVWKTRYNDKMSVLKSLCGVECDGAINIGDSWVQDLVTAVAEKVSDQIVKAQVGKQVAAAKSFANRAEIAATDAEAKVNEALVGYATEEYVNTAVAGVDVTEQLNDYALKTYVDEQVAGVDVSEQLKDYAKAEDVYTRSETDAKVAASL